MKNKKDFDFIKKQFDNDGIIPPDELCAESVSELLENAESSAPKKKLIHGIKIKAAISAAACFALILAAVFAFPHSGGNEPVLIQEKNGVSYFKSYEEINSVIKELKSLSYTYDSEILKSATAEEGISVDIADTKSSGGYGQTYLQVDSVDEADIIKTDGQYIYYVSDNREKINIFRAENEKTTLAAEIAPSSDDENGWKYICDMYISKDRLVVNLCGYDYNSGNSITYCEIYNISAPESPVLINSFRQSGNYVSSRLIGEMVYIVSEHRIEPEMKETYIPEVCCGGAEKNIAASDICLVNKNEPGYIVITAVNINSSEAFSDTKAAFGASAEIYCNERNMFITGFGAPTDDGEIQKISIIRAELRENGIEFAASGEVAGNNIDSQFSMDEKDGFLRIATTSYSFDEGKDSNNLFILNDKLEIVGSITGFAEDESIKAVRFIGDKAYVITYKQIDPLFIIDVSEPASPEILGEVEITGFSSLLVPIDENRLLGIGYSTAENEFGEASDGIKLALFDISDSANPAVLDEKVLRNAMSDAQFTHKALVVNSIKDYYAIPITQFSNNNERIVQSGVLTFDINGNNIGITNRFSNPSDTYAGRLTYIGDYIYSFDSNDNLYSYLYE